MGFDPAGARRDEMKKARAAKTRQLTNKDELDDDKDDNSSFTAMMRFPVVACAC